MKQSGNNSLFRNGVKNEVDGVKDGVKFGFDRVEALGITFRMAMERNDVEDISDDE